MPNNIAQEFFGSVYPTISSGQSSKVMIVSTIHGMNMFYKMWMDANNKRNDYVPIEVHWSEVFGRDEEWKEQTIRNTSLEQFQTEFECEFLGSIDTLISASKLKSMAVIDPQTSLVVLTCMNYLKRITYTQWQLTLQEVSTMTTLLS